MGIVKILKKFNIGLILVLVAYILLRSRYMDHIPIWDGYYYAIRGIFAAIDKPFSIFNFNNAGHNSMLYLFLIGFPQYFDKGNLFLFHLPLLILGTAAVFFFYKIVDFLFPQKELNFEKIILTFLCAFYPATLASSIHINIDFGIYVFSLMLLYSLFYEKNILVFISGTTLVFTKETGIFIYFAFLIIHFFYLILSRKKSIKKLLPKIYLFIPFLLTILAIYYTSSVLHILYQQFGSQFNLSKSPFMDIRLPPNSMQKVSLAYFIGIFIVNFNWILSLAILFGLVKMIFLSARFLIRRKIHALKDNINLRYLLIIIYFLTAVFITTLFKTYFHLRYFSISYPLLIIVFYIFLRILVKNKLIRVPVLILVSLIFFISCFRTMDPVSKKIFGICKFGKHDLLNMVSLTGEWFGGCGRDQLAYNLEFTYISKLRKMIYQDLRGKPVFDLEYFYDEEGAKTVRERWGIDIEDASYKWYHHVPFSSPELYFIKYFFIYDQDIQWFENAKIPLDSIKTYDIDGYQLKVYKYII